jgi:hypothetical protein
MSIPVLIGDELLSDVIAAGKADIVVGLPTQNHARTAGPVARAIMAAFSGPLVRQRAVLLNLDGNSTDGTPEVVQAAAARGGDIVSGQYALRTIHHITAPYHGVPGRGTALRTIFTVADLLRASVVVVADPTAVTLTAGDVARWVQAVSSSRADYVKPVVPRAAGSGPLITQIVRPLLRAACGQRLAEPLDTQLACSGHYAARALAEDHWALPAAEVGVDAFLTVLAMTSGFSLIQVATEASGSVEAERRPRPAEVFHQVMAAVFEALCRNLPAWTEVTGSQSVTTLGRPPLAPAGLPQFSARSFAEAFRNGLDALAPLLPSALDVPLLEGLRAAAAGDPVVIDDGLWARTVFSFLAAAARKVAPAHRLAQMLEPLYLGRVASVLNDPTPVDWLAKQEALALAFEEHKQAFAAAVRREEEDDGTQHARELARSA